MKKDNLNNYIQSHREEFEVDFNPSVHWEKMDLKCEKKSNILSLKWLKYAAAITILLTTGFLVGRSGNPVENTLAKEELQNKFNEVNNYYTNQVNNLLVTVKAANIDETVLDDIKILDEQYQQLETEFLEADFTKREVILNAMIQNAHIRADILQYVLTIINQYNHGNDIQPKTIKI